MEKSSHSRFGERIRKRRVELGLTQMQLASVIGASQSDISVLERCEDHPRMSINRAFALAKALELSMEELFSDLASPETEYEPRQPRQARKRESRKKGES